MLINKNLLFRVSKNKLLKPTQTQILKYFRSIKPLKPEDNLASKNDDGLYVSFTHNSKDGLCINFFYDYYSVGMTYEEFMAVYNKLKDPKNIINEITAGKV